MAAPPPNVAPIFNAVLTDQAVLVNSVLSYTLPTTFDANDDDLSIITMSMPSGPLPSFVTFSNGKFKISPKKTLQVGTY